jgi:DNA uptake protein ComE-like DNA-binding protein
MTTDNLNSDDLAETPGLSPAIVTALRESGITSLTTLNTLDREQLARLKGVGKIGAGQVCRTLGRLMDVGYSTR